MLMHSIYEDMAGTDQSEFGPARQQLAQGHQTHALDTRHRPLVLYPCSPGAEALALDSIG